jgi:hypothetical protein
MLNWRSKEKQKKLGSTSKPKPAILYANHLIYK